MKILKKTCAIALLLVTILGSIAFPTTSNAASNTITIYGKSRYNNLLERNGVDLTCIPLAYTKDGIEHPVYCLNLELDGATETFSYTVNTDNLLTDMEIWRTIVNGYPYKTPKELGCQTKEEAYLATRQAVYCAVYERDPESYHALGGAAGERTLKAMKQIVYTARTSKEIKPSSSLAINANNAMWTIDNINSKYVSKEFTVKAAAGIESYTINLSGNLVEGMKVTNLKNEEKNYFTGDEKFKIIIPIKNIENDGNFYINVQGKVATKPVLYGTSGNSTLQNVAVTGSIYEDGKGSKTEYFFKNETQIVIKKQDQKTKNPLADVKFQILDENKNVVYTDLKTDANGIITVTNLLPGTYYVQEVETKEGYEVYEKLIKAEVQLNEKVKIIVYNLHNQDITKKEEISSEIEVEQSKSEIEILQNNKKVNIDNNSIKVKQNNTDIDIENSNINIEQNNTNIEVIKNNTVVTQNNASIKTIQNNTTIKLPKTGM